MKYGFLQTLFWIAALLFLAFLPMAVAMVGPLPLARGFWVEFGALLGFLGLAILILQCVTTGRFRWFAAGFGFDNLLEFHKQMGIFALLLVLAHPAVLVAADPGFWSYYDPRENAPRAVALVVVTVATVLLVASSLWRLTFRLSYERWRLLHGVLTLGILFLGLGHVVMVDHYGSPLWKKAAFVLMAGAGIYLVIHSRVVRPLMMRRRPYRIVEVRPQRNDSWTLIIEPEGHEGMRYRAGQFLWITVGDSPFSMQQHPFSIASEPSGGRIELTMKELGDFTGSVKKIEPGTRAWLEGPYGVFQHDPEGACGAVFIAGGVGVTPIMSLLRDARERADDARYYLFDGNTGWDDVMFREEIEEMKRRIRLKVVHVLTEPPDDWRGESGYVDGGVLKRHLPEDFSGFSYFICGPGPLLDSVEPILREMGVPATQIHTERFDMV
jgi:predicted ferric reductase